MDSTDKKILNILQGNARISMKELGTPPRRSLNGCGAWRKRGSLKDTGPL
jgi:hypothetical protein